MYHFFFIFLVLITKATPAIITGKVVNKNTRLPLQGVNIILDDYGTTTDFNGVFNVNTNLTENGLSNSKAYFSYIGFKPDTLKVYKDILIELEQIVIKSDNVFVYSGLGDSKNSSMITSHSSFKGNYTESRNIDHFQGLIESISNLHAAGGTSRPRYFKVRGVGESSHYFGEGPPNFSVGFVIDDIDFSGIGMPSSLFDISQINIFKGPQSSIYGSNSMAGLISIRSKNPDSKILAQISKKIGDYNRNETILTINSPITKNINFRISSMKNYSDGFRHNLFLKRKDTNKKDESITRIKIGYKPNQKLNIIATIFEADLKNGYDAWSPDNNEKLYTYSNHDGEDSQHAKAFSIRSNFNINKHTDLIGIVSSISSKIIHGYDGDWGNIEYWESSPYNYDSNYYGYYSPYEYSDINEKHRISNSKEIRLLYKNFVTGYFLKEFNEEDYITSIAGTNKYSGKSEYDFKASAFYVEFYKSLSEKFDFKFNFRDEDNIIKSNIYSNNMPTWDYADTTLIFDDITQNMKGYKIVSSYKLYKSNIYFSYGKGYKAGGTNQNPKLSNVNRFFNPEYMISTEVGFNYITNKLKTRLALFNNKRINQQVSLSSQQVENDPLSFLFHTSNASSGWSKGLEFEYEYYLNNNFNLTGSIGLLDTWIDKFEYYINDSTKSFSGGRELSMSPNTMTSLSIDYLSRSNYYARIGITAKSKYYFSDSHNQKSKDYSILNIIIGKSVNNYSLSFYCNNTLDTRYAAQAFYFGLTPPNYTETLWTSFGDPRELGFRFELKI